MPQVTVTIAGHTYRMACNDGEEAHLQGLAKNVDETIERLKTTFGEIGDQRITVMAAITVADELSEAKKEIARLRAELLELKADSSLVLSSREAWTDEVADSLIDAAARIEHVAQSLNTPSQG